MLNFVDENKAKDFFDKNMRITNPTTLLAKRFFSFYSISMTLMDTMFYLSVNGEYDIRDDYMFKTVNHQLPRQYDIFKQCINKVHELSPSLLDDKRVNLDYKE